jgi:hypothetical protein
MADTVDKRAVRRQQYKQRREQLIEMGILPDRKPGRPRIYDPDTSVAVAKQQKLESQRRTAQHIREELARRALVQGNPSCVD